MPALPPPSNIIFWYKLFAYLRVCCVGVEGSGGRPRVSSSAWLARTMAGEAFRTCLAVGGRCGRGCGRDSRVHCLGLHQAEQEVRRRSASIGKLK